MAAIEGKQIVINRDPVNLETLEQTNAPAKAPYHAPRKIFHRMMPEQISFYSTITSVFPILKWLPAYDVKGDLLADIMAGITVLALQIPQGLAYSKLAGVEPIYGLYSTFFSMIIYPFMATSKHVSMGLYAITSMMCRGVINNFSGVYDKPPTGIEILICLCFMTGFLQTLFGLLRLGNLSLLFSDNFLSAFTVGCSILIINSQLPPSLGINFPIDENDHLGIPSDCINSWISIVKHIPEANTATLILSGGVIVFLITIKYYVEPQILIKRYNFRFPIPSDLIAIIVTTLISGLANLNEKYQMDIVGEIPSGFGSPELPRFDLMPSLITDAIIMASVASVCQISLAKLASKKYNYPISLNQEILAYGTTNLFCSFFHSFPTCASLARTSVNENAGTRTQLTGLICSGLLVSFLFFFTSYLAPLPKATLSSIILVAMIPSTIIVTDLFKVYHVSRFDSLLYLVTLITVTILGVNLGIVCGLATSVAIVLIRVAIPTSSVKFPLAKSEIYLSPEVYQGLETREMNEYQVSVFNFQGPLTFLSAATFKTDIHKKLLEPIVLQRTKMDLNNNQARLDGVSVDGSDSGSIKTDVELKKRISTLESKSRTNMLPTTVILDMSQVIHIDITGIEILTELQDDMEKMKVKLLLACCSISVLSTLERSGFIPDKVKKSECYLTVHDAVTAVKSTAVQQLENSSNLNGNGAALN